MIWIKDPEVVNLWYSSDENGNRCEITEIYNKNWQGFIYSIYHGRSLLIKGQTTTLEEAKDACVKSYNGLIQNLKDFVRKC